MTDHDNTLQPEAFDLDSWLTDAKLPERPAPIYQRPDLVAELLELEARIQNEQEAAAGEETAGGQSLLRRYRKLAADFEASKLTLFCRATPRDEQRDIVDSFGGPLPHDASDQEKKERAEQVGAATIAASIVAVSRANGPREPVEWTAEQVRRLEKAVGDAQWGSVTTAWLRACRDLPAVSADFLQKYSSPEGGDE